MAEQVWVQSLIDAISNSGLDLPSIGRGWAKAAPTVAIVPAFGLRAVPGPTRAMLGLTIAICIAPALQQQAIHKSLALDMLSSAVQGIPIALAAAIPLWAATMAGGVIDSVRGSSDQVNMPNLEGRPTPLAVPFGMLASTAFLATGGPARVATALMRTPVDPFNAWLQTAAHLTSGIEIAVAVAAPVLGTSIVVEVASALLARSANPAQILSLLSPLRAFAILGITALTFHRMLYAIGTWMGSHP